MTTQTAERQDLYKTISALSDAAKEKLEHYVSFLRYEDWLEEQEDAEDIEYLKTLKPEDYENAIPLEDVIKEFEAEHGPLYQN